MTASTPAKKTASSRKPAAAKYTVTKTGTLLAVANEDGARVALLHPRDVDLWAVGTEGRTLRKYREIVVEGRVRNWSPLDKKIEGAVFAAAAKHIAAEAKKADAK